MLGGDGVFVVFVIDCIMFGVLVWCVQSLASVVGGLDGGGLYVGYL